MAFLDVIDDYTQGSTGAITDGDGQSVTYVVTDGTDNRDDQYHGDQSGYLYADGDDVVTVTFDQEVVGATLVLYGGDDNEFYNVMINGEVVDLNQMIADGEATFENIGTTPSYVLNEDGTMSGDHYKDGSEVKITFNVPVTSIGAVGSGLGNTQGSDGLEIGIDTSSFNVVCFAKGTSVMTGSGAKQVEDLRVGDTVETLDNGFKPIQWMGRRRISEHVLRHNPKLRPVCIRAGALGCGLPHQDLRVSRQHRVLISSKIALEMFGVSDVLIPAIKLIGLPGIEVDDTVDEVDYFHVLLDAHEVIFAQGAPAESLYTGPEGLRSMSQEAREEIFTIFPELRLEALVQPCIRLVPEPAKQKRLIKRHAVNKKALLELFET
jgi:hypothetical protein